MPAIVGTECKIYLNTSVFATPTWVEWLSADDVTITIDHGAVDVTCRGSGGFTRMARTLTALQVTGNTLKRKEDPTFVAMELAAKNGTIVDILVMDGVRTSADSDGWRLDAIFSKWDEAQGLTDRVSIDFTLDPADSVNAPTAVSGPQPAE